MKRCPLLVAVTIVLIIVGIHQSHSQENNIFDARILGKWQSDKERTLAWIKDYRSSEYEVFKKVEYGKLILEFTKEEIVSSWAGTDELARHFPYRIVYMEGSIAILISPHPFEDRNEIRIIKFEGKDSISIYSARYESKEYFRRIE